MSNKPNVSKLEEAWKTLEKYFMQNRSNFVLSKLFEDRNRFHYYSLKFKGILYDFSKNLIDDQAFEYLVDLAYKAKLRKHINQMFSGKPINFTEGRPALHIALRNLSSRPIYVDGVDVMPQVRETLERMGTFAEAVRDGTRRGYTDKEFTDIVNIGIGGSDLGPEMVCKALRKYGHPRIKCHFLSNIDGNHIDSILSQVNPETTLFIVSSKTFTTQETITNANSAKKWLLNSISDSSLHEKAISSNFIAVSTNEEAVVKFGINKENMFPFWDWVGGRYSVWSAIGISVMIYIGKKNFMAFLKGAHLADQHFSKSPFDINIPVIMALLGIWYNNFFDAETHAIIPYNQDMSRFAAYFQQGDMESNGKRITVEGKVTPHSTGPIIWGEPGTNAQHSFFQLLHQGTKLVPVDFIVAATCEHEYSEHHKILLSNFCAQSEALAFGKTEAQVKKELKEMNYTPVQINRLLPHKVFPGNKPSSSFVLQSLRPRTLGTLMAFYEHKIFVQGVIWRINSFDQWGVELGKQLAKKILEDLNSPTIIHKHDQSTEELIKYIKRMNRMKEKNKNY